ncbi:MAG: hypothetical protein KatS3mg015_0844 [Fimbriimonadales bacterium]|nr:MAG: hypothetical protein KatS3mg015_0844 [Fimbriimonadales bacterium]
MTHTAMNSLFANIPIWPEGASKAAFEMDALYLFIVGLTIFFSAIVFGLVLYFVGKYYAGSKADRSNPSFHNLKLELAWSLIPLALGLFVFVWAAKLYVEVQAPISSENALDIYVVGKQWMWQMQHPTGQRENNELHIPVGRPVKLTMISQDVIHSFFVPAFRVKNDVVPGRYRTLWFEPTKVGKYHLFCAEYCGTKHSEMVGWIYVMEPEDYEKWLKDNQWGMGNEKGDDGRGRRRPIPAAPVRILPRPEPADRPAACRRVRDDADLIRRPPRDRRSGLPASGDSGPASRHRVRL